MNNSYCWKPTQAQALLLKASLFDDPLVIKDAWEKWQTIACLDDLDQGSFRLLPLLYNNLKRHRIATSDMNKLKGVYRQTWYANQILFHDVFAILAQFEAAKIPTLLLKGGTLAFFHYKDFGLRPMSDIDVLVPTSQFEASMNLLNKSGWQSVWTESYDKAFWLNNTAVFHNSSGRKIELHWYAISQNRRNNIDDNFWKRSIPVQYEGLQTRATCPSDTLFHVCIHGAKWDDVPPIRWIADAIQILKTSGVDWDIVIEEGRKRQLMVGLKETLLLLNQEYNAKIPPEVVRDLIGMSVTKKELALFESLQIGSGNLPSQKEPEFWKKYKKLMSFKGVNPVSFDFIYFLQHWWNLQHAWEVFFYVPVAFGKWFTNKIILQGRVRHS